MIILTQTSDQLNISLTSSVSTNQPVCYVSYRQTDNITFTPGRNVVTTNNTSTVTLLSGLDNYARGIDYVSVFNTDVAPVTATIVARISSVDYNLWRGILGAGERCEYNNRGFVVKDYRSVEKMTSGFDYSLSATPYYNINTLSANTVNSTVTLANVNDLRLPVIANKFYWFRFVIRYQSASTATGAFFSISGPATNYLNFSVQSSNAATNIINFPNGNNYDGGTLAGASANNPNLRCIIEGMIEPSADGNVVPRFRSETAGSAITCISGSFVEWEEIL
jgi:hypothetical protein